MKVEKKKLYLYIYIIIATFILFLVKNTYIFCVAEILLVVLLIIFLQCDVKHPLVLFLTIFILYQISFPILNNDGIVIYEKVNLNQNYYIYSWLATISFIVFFGKMTKINYKGENIHSEININYIKIPYAILSGIAIISSICIIKLGYQSKYEISQNSSMILVLGNMAYTTLIPLTLYFFISANIKKKNKIAFGTITLLLMLFGVFTFGERDYIINYLIELIIYYFTVNRIKMHKIIIIGLVCVLFLSTSSSLKMLWLSDRYKNTAEDNLNIIQKFLNSDFASAGFNFNYILNNCETKLYGKSYVYDFLSPVDDILIFVKKYSATNWYQQEYWSTRKTGLGFSILAEGYLNFGVIGIFIEMFLLARMIKFMYKISNKNSYYYILYIGFMTLAMYSCRESLANIISPFVKYHVLIAIFIYLISNGRKDKTNEKNIEQ